MSRNFFTTEDYDPDDPEQFIKQIRYNRLCWVKQVTLNCRSSYVFSVMLPNTLRNFERIEE